MVSSPTQFATVTEFDPQFNAITGYNGSGKSNILDSICFVMGITNLQQVRAANLQELVYKEGQAGVTMATVAIVLSNADKSRSSVGCEELDEITISRQLAEAVTTMTTELETENAELVKKKRSRKNV